MSSQASTATSPEPSASPDPSTNPGANWTVKQRNRLFFHLAQALAIHHTDIITEDVYQLVIQKARGDRNLVALSAKPSRSSLNAMWTRFNTESLISKKKQTGRPRRNRDDIIRLLSSGGKFSLRKIADECKCSIGLVQKVAKKELKMRYYFQRTGQVLNEANILYRFQFSQRLLDMFNSKTIDIDNFCIIDKSYIEVGEHRHKQNNGFWRKSGDTWEIPITERPLNPKHIMIFCVLHSKLGVIGPYFMKDIDPLRTSMNQYNFMAMVDLVVPQIKEKLGPLFETCWWFQDGAPPHFAKNSIEKLKSYFGNRICARGSEFSWPPFSPDLTPLDYWFWNGMKTYVGSQCPQTLDQVESIVKEYCSFVTPQMVRKAIHDMPARLQCLREREGRHFEHIFKEWKRHRRSTQSDCPYCGTKHGCLCESCDVWCMRQHIEGNVDEDDEISDLDLSPEDLELLQ